MLSNKEFIKPLNLRRKFSNFREIVWTFVCDLQKKIVDR